jgi:protein ImuB
MRRVISVWLPELPIDRLRRLGRLPETETPFVTAAHDGNRRVVAAACPAARAAGIAVGMKLSHAQALCPGLAIAAAEPEADAAWLDDLALACLRHAPLVAADPPDGLWLDVTGCADLVGGEAALRDAVCAGLAAEGLAVRAALADTPGAAHALARHGPPGVISPGGSHAALAPLPLAALRLPPETCAGLARLGFASIGDLAATPRAPLARRFGPLPGLRLDHALGAQFETIRPLSPPDAIARRLAFVEPIGTADAFAIAIDRLTRHVCLSLERTARGARRLDLLFERLDGAVQAIRIGTARPSHDAAHLARLLRERLEGVDPGEGVEAMRLLVALAEPLAAAQTEALATRAATADVTDLVDRLSNRLGAERVYRLAPVESDVPERSVRRVPPLEVAGGPWPSWPRPARLLTPPQPVSAIAPLPDQPPALFIWRRHRHRIRRADGPERITGEWWKRDGETLAVRDYFAVEDEQGRRFWLFRHGDGQDPASGDLGWFLHGVF